MDFSSPREWIYVGGSSCNVYERTKEYHSERESKKEESHQIKCWLTDNRELEEPPNFTLKTVQYFTDPMTRQLAEAVRIDLRREGLLNSKSEHNRYRVPRLK